MRAVLFRYLANGVSVESVREILYLVTLTQKTTRWEQGDTPGIVCSRWKSQTERTAFVCVCVLVFACAWQSKGGSIPRCTRAGPATIEYVRLTIQGLSAARRLHQDGGCPWAGLHRRRISMAEWSVPSAPCVDLRGLGSLGVSSRLGGRSNCGDWLRGRCGQSLRLMAGRLTTTPLIMVSLLVWRMSSCIRRKVTMDYCDRPG